MVNTVWIFICCKKLIYEGYNRDAIRFLWICPIWRSWSMGKLPSSSSSSSLPTQSSSSSSTPLISHDLACGWTVVVPGKHWRIKGWFCSILYNAIFTSVAPSRGMISANSWKEDRQDQRLRCNCQQVCQAAFALARFFHIHGRHAYILVSQYLPM
jgi:hypothetical protein